MKYYCAKVGLLTIFICISINNIFGQVYGYIVDERGEALSFATVLVKGTTIGTSANIDGYYELDLKSNTEVDLIYSYVGYKSKLITTRFDKTKLKQNIQLEPAAINIQEFVLDGNAKDPAYAIIKKVQAKRKYFLDAIPAYQCNAYVKGLIEIDSVPDKLLGIPIEGVFEDNRDKTLYLSETESMLIAEKGRPFKEIIKASVVSGDDQGVSFNSAAEMDFNIFKNTFKLGKDIISPLAANALLFYRYKLNRSYFDEFNRKIYEIQVIPKGEETPCYAGKLFILDESWALHSSELGINGSRSFEELLDTLVIQQQYIPINGSEFMWPFKRRFIIGGSTLGFSFIGNFNAVYSDYTLDNIQLYGLKKKESFRYEESALTQSKDYFDSIRPIPLTPIETIDYAYRDSIESVEIEQQDSLPVHSNAFRPKHALLGYSWKNKSNNKELKIASLIEHFIFNPVQGRLIQVNPELFFYADKDKRIYKKVSGKLSYGLAEKKLRYEVGFDWKQNDINKRVFKSSIGIRVRDFNDHELIHPLIQSITALYFNKNPVKLYEEKFASIAFNQKIGSGIGLNISLSGHQRALLNLNSDFSYFNTALDYQENIPAGLSVDEFVNMDVLKLGINISFNPGMTYKTYPGKRYYTPSKWPTFTLSSELLLYKDAFSIKGALEVSDDQVPLGFLGESRFYILLRGAINPEQLNYIDYFHFTGNDIPYLSDKQLQRGLFLFPYHTYSTSNWNLSSVFEHDMKGLIFSRLPILKKTGLSTVIRIGSVIQANQYYTEYSMGIDRIGVGPWRVLRVDYVFKTISNYPGISNNGFRFSIDF